MAEKPRGVDTSSWDSVGRLGSDGEVVAFLQRAPNLAQLSLDTVISRLMSKSEKARKEFYAQVYIFENLQIINLTHFKLAKVYRERLVYSEALWSLGFVLEDEKSIAEFLSMRKQFVAECGPYLEVCLAEKNYLMVY